MAQTAQTPLMKQYDEMKKKHPDAILLFRIGDFYEIFSDDAITASEILGIMLTRRANGSAKSIELAGFPHHALDTYLPKLVRAGKRVAICEQQTDDKQKVEEYDKSKSEEPTKPTKKMAVKEINCNLTTEQLRELGEPVAYFTMNVPKEAKNLGKCVYKKDACRPMLENILVEPEYGKMVACDTHILYVVDVDCDGVWPKGKNEQNPFRCYVDAKALSAFAGKSVDVAVWEDGSAVVTGCEADGVRSQTETKANYPNWKRAIPQNTPVMIAVQTDGLKPLRDFMKANMGKTKKERENRTVSILTDRASDMMKVEITENRDWNTRTIIAETSVKLTDNADWYIRMIFRADLFYYSIQEDFGGVMYFIDESRPVKFLGEQRESILMPMGAEYNKKTYVTDDYNKTK